MSDNRLQSIAARVYKAQKILNSILVVRPPVWQLVCGSFCLQFRPNYDVNYYASVANPFKALLRVTFILLSVSKLV